MRTTHIPPPSRRPGERAFSLIEVVLAIGIVAFALVTVIALLPVGLGSMKHAREQAAGAACVSQIAESLLTAATTSGSTHATGVWANSLPSWTVGQTVALPLTTGTIPVSLGGLPAFFPMDQRLIAYVQVWPPASAVTTGTALITVAWPSTAKYKGNGTSPWTNAEGFISSWVVLPPSPQ